MKRILFSSLAVLAVMTAAPAMAAVTTMNTSQPVSPAQVGNQIYSGVGLEFDALTTIHVHAIGVYDSGADGLFNIDGANPRTTQLSTILWNTTTHAQIAQMDFTVVDPGTLDANYRFKDVAVPVTLAPGRYAIVAYGFNWMNKEHNSNLGGSPDLFDGAGVISFVKSVWGTGAELPSTTLAYPVNSNASGINYFGGPNMKFDAAIPAPGAILLVGIGTAVVGALRRRSL